MKAPPNFDGKRLAAVIGGLFLLLVAGRIVFTMRVSGTTPLGEADPTWTKEPILVYLTPGIAASLALGFLGFLIALWSVRASAARRATAFVARGLVRTAAAFFGAVFVTIAVAGAWILANPGLDWRDAAAEALHALREPGDPMRLLVLGGALAGFAVAAYARGEGRLRRTARAVTGLIAGAATGLVAYAFAYVVAVPPAVADSQHYLIHFARAAFSFTVAEYALVFLGAFVGLAMSRYSWRLHGIFTLTALLAVVVGYLGYSLTVTIPHVPPQNRPFSWLVFVAEAVSLTMVLLYSFYTLDVATRKRWEREPKRALFSSLYLPKVVFQVPTYNEPPELVYDTLRSLMKIDYPEDRYLVMVVDDSTRPECAIPLRRFCVKNRIPYLHRDDRRGFKAGALNYALARTPADVDLIAVIDADYQVLPEFLHETVGYFSDPELAWIQTPQDYRNEKQSFLTQQYYLADKYFYRTVLPSRNEENSIIFCGTMGILRRHALEHAGGWGENYITEDAELSVRLLSKAWKSLYVNKTYGRGLIPATFEGYKKQHYRWAFGGGQILRGHFGEIFMGKLTKRQRFDYLVGSLHWFEGIFILVLAMAVLVLAWGDLLALDVLTHHANEVLLLGLVPFFLLTDGFTRLHLVLRKSLKFSPMGTARVIGMWFAVKFSNSTGAFKGLFGFKIPFVRTPKAPKERPSRVTAFKHSLRITRFESTFTVVLAITATLMAAQVWVSSQSLGKTDVARILLTFWLLYYTFMFGSAPLYAYRSYTTLRAEAPSPRPRPIVDKVVA